MTVQDVDDVIHALGKVLRHYEMTTDGERERSHWFEAKQAK
jgi:hypothetical protein